MEHTVINNIRRKVTRAKYGEVFFVSSFLRYDTEYVAKLLSQFEKEGLIERISKGVYLKIRKTRFGVVYPQAYDLVKEIAKRDHAEVIPTGETAANRLGFSTQVPMNTCFLTSGSARTLTLGGRKVTLRHGAPRNFAYKGKLMPELVQALKSVGVDNISDSDRNRVAQLLRAMPEEETREHDLALSPEWIRELIREELRRGQMD